MLTSKTVFFYLLIASLLVGVVQAASTDTELVLGVHPYKSAQKIFHSFSPLTDYLSRELDRPVRLQVSPDYETHVRLIGTNQIDIAYMGPVPFLVMQQRYSSRRIIAQQLVSGKPTYHGHIFVRSDSTVKTLADLKGKRFAFVDPLSTMGYRLPQYVLMQAGIRLSDLGGQAFLGSHDNVALGVLGGNFDAGSMRDFEFHIYQERGLRKLSTIPSASNHVFVAGEQISAPYFEKLKETFLSITDTHDGLDALHAIAPVITGLAAADASVFRDLESLLKSLPLDTDRNGQQ